MHVLPSVCKGEGEKGTNQAAEVLTASKHCGFKVALIRPQRCWLHQNTVGLKWQYSILCKKNND